MHDTNLEKGNKEEDEQHTSRISSFAVSTEIFPLKQGFCEQDAGKCGKSNHCDR